MPKEEKIAIKQVETANFCPKCYNKGLQLTFYKKVVNSSFYRITHDHIENEMKCNNCNSYIYPIDWTPEIEGVINYYKRMVKPEKKKVKYKALFFVLVFFLIALLGTAIYLFSEGII